MAISNKTKEPRERIFINFFVVDPDFILSTEEEKLDESFILVKRQEKGEEMMNLKKGWGFIRHGNSGNVEYIDNNTKKEIVEYNDVSGPSDNPSYK
jgi:hypothetical protein